MGGDKFITARVPNFEGQALLESSTAKWDLGRIFIPNSLCCSDLVHHSQGQSTAGQCDAVVRRVAPLPPRRPGQQPALTLAHVPYLCVRAGARTRARDAASAIRRIRVCWPDGTGGVYHSDLLTRISDPIGDP